MATMVLTDCKFYIGGYDFSGNGNRVKIESGAEILDATQFNGSGTRAKAAGLKMADWELEGFSEFGTGLVEAVMFSQIGSSDVPTTIIPTLGATGDRCYFLPSAMLTFDPLTATVGQLVKFNAKGGSSSSAKGLQRGTVLDKVTITSTTNGTAVQVGAVGANQKVYAIYHLLDFSGFTSIDVKIQSDNSGAFSSPTDQITFANKTAIGSEYPAAVSGAITDDYWRVVATLNGGGPGTATFLVALAIS